MVALKIRGLPYQTRREELYDFFKDFAVREKSVVFGLGPDGRKNGFGSILFENEAEATQAMTALQRQHVGDRYVELSPISYNDYLNFNSNVPKGGAAGGQEFVKLSQYVGDDNKDRCLVMRGLPYRINVEEIVAFFEGYGNLSKQDVFIEQRFGKRTGSALVIFENQDVAQDAKQTMNKQIIGQESRYVELFDCNDEFMQKICNLYPTTSQ